MSRRVDHTGKKYGRLTAIEYSYSSAQGAYWKFRCDCGNYKVIRISSATSKKTTSCGCYHIERNKKTSTLHGDSTRGVAYSRLYYIYEGMKDRCNNPKRASFKWYGGKGINICEEWNNYLTFKKWALSNGYSKDLTIDRKNSDEGYAPENCQWITASENIKKALNKRWTNYQGRPISRPW